MADLIECFNEIVLGVKVMIYINHTKNEFWYDFNSVVELLDVNLNDDLFNNITFSEKDLIIVNKESDHNIHKVISIVGVYELLKYSKRSNEYTKYLIFNVDMINSKYSDLINKNIKENRLNDVRTYLIENKNFVLLELLNVLDYLSEINESAVKKDLRELESVLRRYPGLGLLDFIN